MPLLEVCCAIIEKDGTVLSVQRNTGMKQALLWEFPGGKVEPAERAEDAILREIKEELGITVKVKSRLPSHVHENISLIPFICSLEGGRLTLYEHKDARWLPPFELQQLNWCPADIPVLKEYLKIKFN